MRESYTISFLCNCEDALPALAPGLRLTYQAMSTQKILTIVGKGSPDIGDGKLYILHDNQGVTKVVEVEWELAHPSWRAGGT